MERGGCIYIITNYNHTTLYTGVTADLQARISQHRQGVQARSFSHRYRLYKLVYYRFYPRIEEAIAEEKRIKGGSRRKKEALIIEANPGWRDLYEEDVKYW